MCGGATDRDRGITRVDGLKKRLNWSEVQLGVQGGEWVPSRVEEGEEDWNHGAGVRGSSEEGGRLWMGL